MLISTGNAPESSESSPAADDLVSTDKKETTCDESKEMGSQPSDEDDLTFIDPKIELKLQQYLNHHSVTFPMDSLSITSGLNKV